MTETERLVIALHESGHALAALWLDVPFVSVSVLENGDGCNGRVAINVAGVAAKSETRYQIGV